MSGNVNSTFKDAPPPGAVQGCPPLKSKVLKAYFAEKKLKENAYVEQPYTVGPKDTHKTIAAKVKNVDPVRLKQTPLVPGEVITLHIKKKTYDLSFSKLDRGTIGDKVFIVVETADLRGSTVTVQILGSNNTTFAAPDAVVSVLQGGAEKANLTATVGEYSKKTAEYANAAQFEDHAVIEVELRPAGQTKPAEWSRKIQASAEKLAFFHLTVTAAAGNEIEYTTEDDAVPSPSKEKGIFLNRKDQWFKLRGCFCNRDFSAEDMLAIIYMLRDKQKMLAFRETFFDKQRSDMLSSLTVAATSKLSDNMDKVGSFTDALNAMFTKFGITSCKRKVHFIAQMYLETMNFRASCEAIGVCDGYGGGCDFRGRGMKQITHDYNYLAYYDYVKGTEMFKTYMGAKKVNSESVAATIGRNKELSTTFYNDLKTFARTLASDLFSAMDSGGWYSTINRKKTLVEMDKGLEDANVKSVTYEINGGYNNLTERQDYAKWLRAHFKYDMICAAK